jgi:hypothetical protein
MEKSEQQKQEAKGDDNSDKVAEAKMSNYLVRNDTFVNGILAENNGLKAYFGLW